LNAQVSWRRENNAILPTGGVQYKGNVLKIHSVKKEDRGTYYCVADNKIGKPARRAVAVEVEFPPAVRVSSGERVGQAFGYSVEMTCQVEAYPPPTITWVHDGIQLTTNRDYAVDGGYASTDDYTTTSVRIKRLGNRQTGRYECRAQNKLGQGEGVIEVVRQYEPNCIVGICEGFAAGANAAFLSTLCLFVLVARMVQV